MVKAGDLLISVCDIPMVKPCENHLMSTLNALFFEGQSSLMNEFPPQMGAAWLSTWSEVEINAPLFSKRDSFSGLFAVVTLGTFSSFRRCGRCMRHPV